MERGRSLLIFKVKSHISRSLGLYKEFWHLDPCGQDIARTIWPRILKLSVYTLYGQRKKPIYFQPTTQPTPYSPVLPIQAENIYVGHMLLHSVLLLLNLHIMEINVYPDQYQFSYRYSGVDKVINTRVTVQSKNHTFEYH